MHFGEKTVGSQNAIKQLYRQYSTTFKKNDLEKNIFMTQSSNLPFDKFYNAFSSTGHIKNFTLDHFKNSQAKSIIEKLMQTKDFNQNSKEDDFALLNQLQTIGGFDFKEPIPLTKTQQKIFNQVVNLMTDISNIKQQTKTQNQEFNNLKIQLKSEGISLPETQQKNKEGGLGFKRYTSKQLEEILQENQKLEARIDSVTQQLAGGNQPKQNQPNIDSAIKLNSSLKKQLYGLKSDIADAGQVDDQDINRLSTRIQELKQIILVLEQKRIGKLTDKDEELRALKHQNEQLRLKTIQMLTTQSQAATQRKAQIIRILKDEEGQKERYLDEMQQLKLKYENALEQNGRLKEQVGELREISYEGPGHFESKVSPFQQSYLDQHSWNSLGKQNYLQNYDPSRYRNGQHFGVTILREKQGNSGKHSPYQYQASYRRNLSPWSGDYRNPISPKY